MGSTNSNDEKSLFSNYGAKTVNIFAPGGEINGITSSILSTWLKTNNNTSKNELSTGIIKNFSATITEGIGIIPTKYKFTWNLNGTNLKCGLDFDNDGKTDTIINNCGTNNVIEHTYYYNNYFAKIIIYDINNNIIDTKITNALVKPYTSEVGTSQAAPIIAGTIALLKATNSNLTLQDIKNRILTTGDNLLSLTGYSITCNRVNVYNALIDEKSPKICIDKHLSKSQNGYYYDIGTVNAGNTKTVSFNIKNSGSSTLSIGKISLQNNSIFNIVSDNCSQRNFNTFESCSILVRIYSSSNGEKVDTLIIPTNTSLGEIKINLKANITGSVDSGGGCNFSSSGFNIYWLAIILLIILRRKLKI